MYVWLACQRTCILFFGFVLSLSRASMLSLSSKNVFLSCLVSGCIRSSSVSKTTWEVGNGNESQIEHACESVCTCIDIAGQNCLFPSHYGNGLHLSIDELSTQYEGGVLCSDVSIPWTILNLWMNWNPAIKSTHVQWTSFSALFPDMKLWILSSILMPRSNDSSNRTNSTKPKPISTG